MAKTTVLDPQGVLRVLDQEVLLPRTARGEEDFAKTDWFKITANDTALATNVRKVTLSAGNDDATVTAAWPAISGKGNVGLFIPSGAAAPTWAAYMEGSLYYDTATRKLMLATNAAWVIVGTQS